MREGGGGGVTLILISKGGRAKIAIDDVQHIKL